MGHSWHTGVTGHLCALPGLPLPPCPVAAGGRSLTACHAAAAGGVGTVAVPSAPSPCHALRRCAHLKGDDGRWNKFGGRLAWDATAVTSNNPGAGPGCAKGRLRCPWGGCLDVGGASAARVLRTPILAARRGRTAPRTASVPRPLCPAAWGGRGSRKAGDDYPAAPNIDHTQARVVGG